MNDSGGSPKGGGSDSAGIAFVDSVTIDFDHLVKRADALGAKNDEERSERAGISLSTFYRIKAGTANLRIRTVGKIAKNLRTTSARLMGLRR